MSYSITKVGTPEEVVAELDKASETLTGYSKTEFDEVLPALKTLVNNNWNKVEGNPPMKMDFRVNGHGSTDGQQRQCQVAISITY